MKLNFFENIIAAIITPLAGSNIVDIKDMNETYFELFASSGGKICHVYRLYISRKYNICVLLFWVQGKYIESIRGVIDEILKNKINRNSLF